MIKDRRIILACLGGVICLLVACLCVMGPDVVSAEPPDATMPPTTLREVGLIPRPLLEVRLKDIIAVRKEKPVTISWEQDGFVPFDVPAEVAVKLEYRFGGNGRLQEIAWSANWREREAEKELEALAKKVTGIFGEADMHTAGVWQWLERPGIRTMWLSTTPLPEGRLTKGRAHIVITVKAQDSDAPAGEAPSDGVRSRPSSTIAEDTMDP